MSSLYSDEEEESDEEEDSEDGVVVGYTGKGSDDDDYVDEATPEVEDDDASLIMELIAPMPAARAPRKTVVKTTAPTPAIVPNPAPAPAPAPIPVPAFVPARVIIAAPSNDISTLLENYGEAVLRCSLDHTPATAAKLEDDIAKASHAVVQFHRATILKIEQAPSRIDVELLVRLQDAITERQKLKQEIVTLSKDITQKDEEAKWKAVALENFKSLHTDPLRREMELRAQLSKIEKESEAKRKRVEESVFKASKKGTV